MMNRWIVITGSFLLAAGVVFGGCSDSDGVQAGQSDSSQPDGTQSDTADPAPLFDTGLSGDSGTSTADTETRTDAATTADTATATDTVTTAPVAGCADGDREGFADVAAYPAIAGCGGAWDVPGLFNKPPSCARQAGNSGVNAAGTGCSVTDLCAPGWSVCLGREKVVLVAGGCDGAMVGATSPVFFTTQMSSTGAFQCATGASATDDLFGCGDLGCDFTSNANVAALCAPLVLSSHNLCKGLRNDLGVGDWCNHLGKYPALTNAWSCGSDGGNEALNVTKSDPDAQGGVLCCRN